MNSTDGRSPFYASQLSVGSDSGLLPNLVMVINMLVWFRDYIFPASAHVTTVKSS